MLTFYEQLYIRIHYSPDEEALVDLAASSSELIAAAGLLVNLLLINRVRLDNGQFTIINSQTTHDDLLDEALVRFASVGPINHDDPEWFQQIAEKLSLGARLFHQIMEKVLVYRHEKKGLLGLSKTIIYPFHDPAVRVALFEPERGIMLHGARPDPITATIIFMAYCWGALRPWKLSRQEENVYEKRWHNIFGEYWGWYDKNDRVEPIEGLTADLRYAIADLTISWATLHLA
jgi:hypothetical protein